MEQERSVDFKTLKAKFQEKDLLGWSKCSRPAVAEKPKLVLPPGGHCSSVVSGINMAVENNTPVVPRVFLRDGLRSSGDKRTVSPTYQPHQASPSLANGDGSTWHYLRERNLPLVLPVPSDHRIQSPAEKEHELEPGKEVLAINKFKKKATLLPFKPVKAPKLSGEIGQGPAYTDLLIRPCSDPGELTSMKKQSIEDRVSLQSDQSTSEYPPSTSDISATSSPPEPHVDSNNRITRTLEKAKKKFSQQQMLISTRTKSFLSPDKTFLSSGQTPEGLGGAAALPTPPHLPHLACISARPFFKRSSSLKPAFDKQLVGDKVRTVGPHPQCIPLRKPLLDLRTLGPVPAKPPRPPVVDLSCYHPVTIQHVSAGETPSKEEPHENPPTCSLVLDAPDFPDFDNFAAETAASEAVNVAALELEVLDLVNSDVKTAIKFEIPDCETLEPAFSVCDPAETSQSPIVQDLNLGSPNIIPLDPSSFPEPINLSEFPNLPLTQLQVHSNEAAVDAFANSYEAHLGAAENQSFPEESELRSQAASNESQTQLSDYQQDSYYETSDNVYEDVENINRFISGQISTKQKRKLKNPYADRHPTKEELYIKKWPRHPWGNTSAEPAAHLTHHVHSNQRLSPSTADHKEQRKREKQRLERERKEQKEREKKENEMRKKFKVYGDEEPMYHARVMVANKVRKNDLPVKSGDTVGIIRTTSCPKGKWLARDANHKYGYISVMNVELNIKDMLELGKKAQAAGRGGNLEADTISIGSRSSSHPILTSSFTDDSEEWACEDDTLSPPDESHVLQQTASEPETSCVHVDPHHKLSESNLEDLHTQTRHEALQKLAFFFQFNKDETDDITNGGGATPINVETSNLLFSVEEPPYLEQEVDLTELELLPPPPLYADSL